MVPAMRGSQIPDVARDTSPVEDTFSRTVPYSAPAKARRVEAVTTTASIDPWPAGGEDAERRKAGRSSRCQDSRVFSRGHDPCFLGGRAAGRVDDTPRAKG